MDLQPRVQCQLYAAGDSLTVVGAVLLIKAAPQIFDRQYAKA